MNATIKLIALLLGISLMTSLKVKAQTENKNSEIKTMKTYVIERDMPGVGALSSAQLKTASQASCTVLTEMGPRMQWIHSYVTDNKIYCVYKAENEEQIREHAKKAGFPANSINEVATIISPETARQ